MSGLEGPTYYIVGESRTNSDNAITKMYGSFFIAMEVRPESGEILDMSCTASLGVTERFLRKIFIGKSLLSQCGEIETEILLRYHGSSAKAVLAAMRDAEKRLRAARRGPGAETEKST